MKYEKVDHRQDIAKLFREAMSRHGLNKNTLEHEKLKHVFSHGYRKSRQTIGVRGEMYCPELWYVVGKPEESSFPVFHYGAAYSIVMMPGVIDLPDELDIQLIKDHFEEVITRAILPVVRAVQTPEQAVIYAINPGGIAGIGPLKWNEYFSKWTSFYGIEDKFKAWDELPT